MVKDTPPSTARSRVAQSIAAGERILGITHANPDGDAVGSLMALGHIAVALKKQVRLYCATEIPPFLSWIESPAPFLHSLDELGGWQPDRIVFLDCADENRAGEEASEYIARHRKAPQEGVVTLCVDHHIANPSFADVNWVDSSMSAAGMMVGLLAEELGLQLSGNLGEAVFLALVSDTGSFSFGNTTALTLQLASKIVAKGLSIAEFTAKYENNWTLGRMHLWGSLMREVALHCSGKVVVSVVTDEHLERYKSHHTDLEGYASWLRRLRGSKVVILARSSHKGSKVSLRSMGDADVQEVAALFGGGGHKAAAGVDMLLPPNEAATMVLEAVCKKFGEPFDNG